MLYKIWQTVKGKYKKLPKDGFRRLRDFMREYNRKKEFVGRLKEGQMWNKTNDPGPH